MKTTCNRQMALQVFHFLAGVATGVREAQRKISFEERLRNMDQNKRAPKAHKYLYLKSVYTEWRKRLRQWASRYTVIESINRQPLVIKKKGRETEQR